MLITSNGRDREQGSGKFSACLCSSNQSCGAQTRWFHFWWQRLKTGDEIFSKCSLQPCKGLQLTFSASVWVAVPPTVVATPLAALAMGGTPPTISTETHVGSVRLPRPWVPLAMARWPSPMHGQPTNFSPLLKKKKTHACWIGLVNYVRYNLACTIK